MRLTLTQQIRNLKDLSEDERGQYANELIANAIINLLQNNQFYGLLLSKLNRQINLKQNQPLGLTWDNDNLILTYNPNQMFKKLNIGDDLLAILEHLSLHIIWMHPLRYNKDDSTTRMATDVAVNQYISKLPKDTITLDAIQKNLNIKLPKYADSKIYLNLLLKKIKKDEQQKGNSKSQQNLSKYKELDSHSGWSNQGHTNDIKQRGNIKKLIDTSWNNTDEKQRGLLPGHIKERLNQIESPSIIDWRQYIKIGMGKIPYDFKPSRARFNRRQAYRMDIPGQISNTILPINIFVDNSGSMGNNEISFLISQIGDFLKNYSTNVNIYTFDTKVHYQQSYSAQNNNQLRFQRVGGGGTRFQSIFDFIHIHSNMSNNLNIILTDGKGEKRLKYYLANNILWILVVPTKNLSVLNPRGNVASLVNDPAFIQTFGWRN